MKGSTLTQHTHTFCLILWLWNPNRLQEGSSVESLLRTWTEDVLCPLPCNSRHSSAPDLLPHHQTKVQWSDRTFKEKEHLHKGCTKSLTVAVAEKKKKHIQVFELHQNISDMMTQWCDGLQLTDPGTLQTERDYTKTSKWSQTGRLFFSMISTKWGLMWLIDIFYERCSKNLHVCVIISNCGQCFATFTALYRLRFVTCTCLRLSATAPMFPWHVWNFQQHWTHSDVKPWCTLSPCNSKVRG